MNAARRAILKKAIASIEQAKEYVDQVYDDEYDALSNMPENLESSERYEKMENAVDILEEIQDDLDDVLEKIEEAMQ